MVELSRRALLDLAGADLETVVVALALEQLEADEPTRATLLGDKSATTPITVRTAFPLSPDRQSEISEQLVSIGLAPRRAVRFEEDADLILGVEFQGDGVVSSWNADDYVQRLDESVQEIIDRTDRASDGG